MLSLPAGTEMFHFPALPSAALCIQAGTTPHDECRVSPFGHPRITTRLPVPRGFSQAPTSFFGSWCQDIHRVLLETWLTTLQMLDARVHYAVLKIRTEPRRTGPPIRRAVRPGRSRKRASRRLPPQDPTACPEASQPLAPVPDPEGNVLTELRYRRGNRITSAPLESMDARPLIR